MSAGFRAEIIGHDHPHRGARGTVDPYEHMVAGGAMMRMTLDQPSESGATACYVLPSEIRRLALQDGGEG